MKILNSALLFTLILAISASYARIRKNPDFFSNPNAIESEIAKIKSEFQNQHNSTLLIDIEGIKASRASDDLVSPKLVLPHYHLYDFNEVTKLYKFGETCELSNLILSRDKNLVKALIWQKYVCKHLKKLPPSFFKTPPFMHLSGSSYVALARDLGGEFAEKNWEEEHTTFLHLGELPNIKFSAWELQNLLNKENLILAENHILLAKKQGTKDNLHILYQQYSREDWEKFLTKQSVGLSFDLDSPFCLVKEGNVCWVQNQSRSKLLSKWLFYLLGIVILLLFFIFFFQRMKIARHEKEENEHRNFILQMLTHELRTPATALKLSTETLRREFDHLPANSQKAFLHICEDLQRLDRIIEASKKYLSLSQNTDFDKTIAKPVSANELIETILAPYPKVICKPFDEEQMIIADRYWVELCLKNLVENAFNHGVPPVEVTLKKEGNAFIISVKDYGKMIPTHSKKLSRPLNKGPTSQGLGLGLIIVEKVMERMNGELSYSSSPTTFTLIFRSAIV